MNTFILKNYGFSIDQKHRWLLETHSLIPFAYVKMVFFSQPLIVAIIVSIAENESYYANFFKSIFL